VLAGRSRTSGSGRTSATSSAKALASASSVSADAAILSNSFWPGSMASISLFTARR
jgi:hypothetical protein